MNRIPSVTRSIAISLGLILASAGAHAKVYRCVVNGNTTYSDIPCEGTDSETVNMVAPSTAKPGSSVAKATPAPVPAPAPAPAPALAPAPAPALAPAPVAKVSAAAKAPATTMAANAAPVPATTTASQAAPPSAAGGKDWRLAGEYSDHVQNSSKTMKRASYGIECNTSHRRPSVYAINGRYSLTAPGHGGNNHLQGPFYDSLDAAATAACAAK